MRRIGEIAGGWTTGLPGLVVLWGGASGGAVALGLGLVPCRWTAVDCAALGISLVATSAHGRARRRDQAKRAFEHGQRAGGKPLAPVPDVVPPTGAEVLRRFDGAVVRRPTRLDDHRPKHAGGVLR